MEPQRTMQGSKDVESHNNKQSKETVLIKEETKVLREVGSFKWTYFLFSFFAILYQIMTVLSLHKVNEKLTCELEMIKQSLEILQRQVQELTAERANSSKQIIALEAENSELTREKEELLSKINEGEYEMKDKCCLLR